MKMDVTIYDTLALNQQCLTQNNETQMFRPTIFHEYKSLNSKTYFSPNWQIFPTHLTVYLCQDVFNLSHNASTGTDESCCLLLVF